MNKHRSKTAEELFRDLFITKSAGLYNEHPVTESELSWADTIIVMEDDQRSEIAKRFPTTYLRKRILCLQIPDMYQRDDPVLKQLLKQKMEITLLAIH